MQILLLVGLGGGIGSVFRYLTSVVVNRHFQTIFPWATLIANVLGCLIIGLLLGFIERHQLTNPGLKYFFITGFCGGYTTFSSFASENMSLFQSQNTGIAFLYIAASILTGLFAVWLGLTIAKV